MDLLSDAPTVMRLHARETSRISEPNNVPARLSSTTPTSSPTAAAVGAVAERPAVEVACGSSCGPHVMALDADLSHRVVANSNLAPASREQYHKLAATLHNAQAVSGVKSIMIASAVAGEGKTLTAANLALTFSESYQRRVLLVDADLRRPSLHRLFGMREWTGLDADVTSPPQALRLRQMTQRLSMLTTGLPSPAPIAELTSERMRRVIQDARLAFDWIIVDTPPLTLLADASLLASEIDGVVLVVKAGSTPLDLVKRALEAIDRKKVLGVVLNASRRPQTGPDGYTDYYYSYVTATAASADGRSR
jgi:protein-tyrosine kinase